MRRSFFSSFAMLGWPRHPEKPITPTAVRSVGLLFTMTLKRPFPRVRGGLGPYWLTFAASFSLGMETPAFMGLYKTMWGSLVGFGWSSVWPHSQCLCSPPLLAGWPTSTGGLWPDVLLKCCSCSSFVAFRAFLLGEAGL